MTLPRTLALSHAPTTTRRSCIRQGREVELIRVAGAPGQQFVSFQPRMKGVAPLLGFVEPDTWIYEATAGVELRALWRLTRDRGGVLGRERVELILSPLARIVDGLDVPHGRIDLSRVRVGIEGPILLEHGLLARLGPQVFLSEPIAPELRKGGPLSRAADVWSLARLTCELVTGHPPSWPAWAVAGRRLGAVLARAMDEDPRRRHRSAVEFAGRVLDELASCGDPSEAPTQRSDAPGPGPGEHRVLHRLQAAELKDLGVWRRPSLVEPFVWMGFTAGWALLHAMTWMGGR
ncbi:MAG: hypothetical protein AAGD10_09585 [Myxococcota bacterium]